MARHLKHIPTRLSRLLPMLALLALLGGQVQEFGHYHDVSDGTTHCLVCQGAADAAAVAALHFERAPRLPALQVQVTRNTTLLSDHYHFDARGPPRNT